MSHMRETIRQGLLDPAPHSRANPSFVAGFDFDLAMDVMTVALTL